MRTCKNCKWWGDIYNGACRGKKDMKIEEVNKLCNSITRGYNDKETK